MVRYKISDKSLLASLNFEREKEIAKIQKSLLLKLQTKSLQKQNYKNNL